MYFSLGYTCAIGSFRHENRLIILYLNMTFPQELVVLHTSTPCMFDKILVHAWRYCGRFKQRTFYIGSLRFKLILACQEVLNWVWPSMNLNTLLFHQIQTLPPSMHHKWKEIMNIRVIL
jgi:hypothetical protein